MKFSAIFIIVTLISIVKCKYLFLNVFDFLEDGGYEYVEDEGKNEEYSDLPYCNMSVPQRIKIQGYPVEEHEVITKDGYILKLHRIPKGIKDPTIQNRPPVFLQHGLYGSSVNFIQLPKSQALAYVLADEGFDVWMGNARGNQYSRKHRRLNPDEDEEFWNFSWHEMGKYDIPAVIDHILRTTKHKKIFYIGHSMGNTMFFAAMVENPTYNKKIKLQISFAPAVIMTNSKNERLSCAEAILNTEGQNVLPSGEGEMMKDSKWVLDMAQRFCDMENLPKECEEHLENACFLASSDINLEDLSDKACQLPAGSSIKSAKHFMQSQNVDHFPRYDYGAKQNYEVYGQSTPPKYDLAYVTAPVVLCYGEEDDATLSEDIITLSKKLPIVKELYNVKPGPFDHSDFIWSSRAHQILYTKVITEIKNFLYAKDC